MKKEFHEVKREVIATLREFGYKTNKVAVEIYGTLVYMDEPHIRALQVMVMRKAEESEEAFKEFTENVVVYSARCKSRALHKMTFKKTGGFEEKFEPGFVTVNTALDMEIIRAEHKESQRRKAEKAKAYGLRDMTDLLCQITTDCCYFSRKSEIIFQGSHCPTGREDTEWLRTNYSIEWGVPSDLDNPVFYVGVDMGCVDSTVIYAVCNPKCKSLREVLNSDIAALYVKLPTIYGKDEILKYLTLL